MKPSTYTQKIERIAWKDTDDIFKKVYKFGASKYMPIVVKSAGPINPDLRVHHSTVIYWIET